VISCISSVILAMNGTIHNCINSPLLSVSSSKKTRRISMSNLSHLSNRINDLLSATIRMDTDYDEVMRRTMR